MSYMESAERTVKEYFISNTGSRSYQRRFDLGGGHYVKVGVTHVAGAAIHADVPVTPESVNYSMQFWSGSDHVEDTDLWLRVDNEPRGSLHFHQPSGSRPESWHIPLPGQFTVLELVDFSFSEAKKVLAWKYP
jgi:hypothetical protein